MNSPMIPPGTPRRSVHPNLNAGAPPTSPSEYEYVAGIYVNGRGGDSVISGNVFQNNQTGIAFVSRSVPTTRVENNVITQNSIGVEYNWLHCTGISEGELPEALVETLLPKIRETTYG